MRCVDAMQELAKVFHAEESSAGNIDMLWVGTRRAREAGGEVIEG